MQNPNYTAEGVPVLRLSNDPDPQGWVMNDKCKVRYKAMVPVVYSVEDQSPVGMARLRREGDLIIADITMHASAYGVDHTLKMLARLIPCACGRAKKTAREFITEFELEFLTLSGEGNIDPSIPALGKRVHRIPDKREMH